MQVTETLSDGLKRAYTVVVPAADLEGRRAAKLSELGRTLRLPGFRPGKVPMPVVRQRFGQSVMAQVVEESIDRATQEMLSARGLRPAETPKVDVLSLDPAAPPPTGPAADLAFKLEFELLPEVALPDFSAIALTRLAAVPDAETVDRALAEIARRQVEPVAVEEDRGARDGDTLVVDFTGRIDGEPFPGGGGTGVSVEVGAGGFIPGFAEQLEGLRPGEQRSIAVTFPAEYGVAELAGKAATFDVTATALRTRPPLVLDDALAVQLGLASLEELRGVIAGQIQRDYDSLSRLRLKRALLDALAERVDFAVPDGLVEGEFAAIWQNLTERLADGTADPEDRAKDEVALRAEYRAIAERRVRLGLLLSEVGRVHGIVVTDEEMTRAMRREAARYRGQEPQVMEFLRKTPQAAARLRGPIFEDKVVDFILELARVEEVRVSAAELAQEEGAAPAALPEPQDAPAVPVEGEVPAA
jgi:trigger factor